MMAPYNPQPAPNNHESRTAAEGARLAPEEGGRQAVPNHAADDASRAVMHPELHDPEWRYYFGAWGG